MGKKQSKSIKIFLILLYTIIPFLAFFFYLSISLNISPDEVLGVFVKIPPKVNYESFNISFDEDIPLEVQEMIKGAVDDIQMGDVKRFIFTDNGEYTIKYTSEVDQSIYYREYIPVGHMYWIKGMTSQEELKNMEKVYVPIDEYEHSEVLLSQILGSETKIEGVENISSVLKGSEQYIGFVSLNSLEKDMKILSLDEKFFLEDIEGSLDIGYSLEGEEKIDFVRGILKRNMERKYGESYSSNIEGVVKINMSGVVAMTRGLAIKMDSVKDYKYPARDLGEFLSNADLTHVSNEVSFVSGCESYSGMRFCSRPEYIETLKASGVDIVELTGNHNNDYGASNNTKSIEMYKELGWDYFGGGLNKEDASKILYKEIRGSTVAFVGYNYYDTMQRTGAIASTNAGANSYSVEKLTSDISTAKQNADVVIVTFQFQECYSYPSSDVIYPICYKPLSTPDQKGVFRKAIDLGADIVVGTQAHQPQTYEVYKEGLIFYGLGNLYFDQYRWIGTRQGIVLSIYVQDGKLLQVKMTPTIMDRDLIPRVADTENRDLLLNLLKSARNF